MPLALYLLALAVFAMGTSEFMLAGLVPDIASGLDVSIGIAGLLTSSFAVGMVIGAPTMAALARRWPARGVLLTCVVIFAVCHIVGAVTPIFILLIGARVVAALANAGFLAVAIRTAAALVGHDQKGRALAVLLSGTTVATIAGVPAGALLGSALGWRSTFWAIALLCIPAALGIMLGIPDRPEDASPLSGAGVCLRAELGQISSPRLFLPMLLTALLNAGTFATFTFLAPIVTDITGPDGWWVPLALALFGIGSFVGVVIAGQLSDQRPRFTIAVGGPLLLLGWLALATIAHHPAALFVLVLSQGALAFAVGSTLITRVLYAAVAAPTMGGSYATAALNLGAAVGPALGGTALGIGAGTSAPVWIAVALTGITVLVALPSMPLLAPRAPVPVTLSTADPQAVRRLTQPTRDTDTGHRSDVGHRPSQPGPNSGRGRPSRALDPVAGHRRRL